MADEPHLGWSDFESRIFLQLFHEKCRPSEERRPVSELWAEELRNRRAELNAALRKLRHQGLVSILPGASGAVDLRSRDAVMLTRGGFEYGMRVVAFNLGSERPPPPAAASVPAPAPPPAPAPAPEIERTRLREEILRLFLERERAQHGFVPIWQVRRAVPGTSPEDFDRALLELQRDDLLSLSKLNDARDTPEDELRDGLVSPLGTRLFFVSKGEKL